MTSVNFASINGTTLTAGATRFVMFSGEYNYRTTEAEAESLVASAGTMQNAYAELTAAPGVGNTVTCTLRKNGADTTIVVTFSGTATQANDTTHTVTVAAGDRLCWSVVTSASTSASTLRISAQYVGDTAKESILAGGSGANTLGADTTTRYTSVGGLSFGDTTQTNVQMTCPTAGTLKKLYIRLTAAPGAGDTRTFTIYKNGSSTGLTVTISDVATTGNDTSNTVAVVAGDLLALQCAATGTPADAGLQFGFALEATTDGDFAVLAGTTDDPSTGATVFSFLNISPGFTFGSETQFLCGQAFYMTALYAQVGVAPGVGKSWALTVRNNATDTALSATISGTNVTGSSTGSVAVANYDNLCLESTPTGTPTSSGTIKWGVNMTFVAPTADYTPVSSWYF